MPGRTDEQIKEAIAAPALVRKMSTYAGAKTE
jgi:hypothetical protein